MSFLKMISCHLDDIFCCCSVYLWNFCEVGYFVDYLHIIMVSMDFQVGDFAYRALICTCYIEFRLTAVLELVSVKVHMYLY